MAWAGLSGWSAELQAGPGGEAGKVCGLEQGPSPSRQVQHQSGARGGRRRRGIETPRDEGVGLEFLPTWSLPRFSSSNFPLCTSDSNWCTLAAPFLVFRVHVPGGNPL